MAVRLPHLRAQATIEPPPALVPDRSLSDHQPLPPARAPERDGLPAGIGGQVQRRPTIPHHGRHLCLVAGVGQEDGENGKISPGFVLTDVLSQVFDALAEVTTLW